MGGGVRWGYLRPVQFRDHLTVIIKTKRQFLQSDATDPPSASAPKPPPPCLPAPPPNKSGSGSLARYFLNLQIHCKNPGNLNLNFELTSFAAQEKSRLLESSQSSHLRPTPYFLVNTEGLSSTKLASFKSLAHSRIDLK